MIALIFAPLALAVSIACGSGGPAPADGEPTQAPTPSDAAAIRSVDVTALTDVATALRQFGSGAIDKPSIVYADITGDQREEAVVPVSSGGSLGNMAYLVLTPTAGSAKVILTRTTDRSNAGGIAMNVEGGQLVETAGEYAAEDPFCCPSVLRKTYFRWDGSQLQVAREEKLPNPGGGGKQ